MCLRLKVNSAVQLTSSARFEEPVWSSLIYHVITGVQMVCMNRFYTNMVGVYQLLSAFTIIHQPLAFTCVCQLWPAFIGICQNLSGFMSHYQCIRTFISHYQCLPLFISLYLHLSDNWYRWTDIYRYQLSVFISITGRYHFCLFFL